MMRKQLELLLSIMIVTFLLGFTIGVYATFNPTPFDFIMFPILEHYGLV
jgi:uncharacterized membrane protein YjdF